MRLSISFGLILLSTLISAQSNFECEILSSFDSTKVSYNANEIPRKVAKLYWKKYDKIGVRKVDKLSRESLKIANPDEEWNSTGIIYEGDKNAQLIYWGEVDKKGFIFLKRGGLGIQISCIIYNLDSNEIESIDVNPLISQMPLRTSIVELKKEVSNHLNCNN